MKGGGTPYRKGVRAERKTLAYLESLGLQAYRTAGSHGAFDIIGLRQGMLLLIQVKTGQRHATRAQKTALANVPGPVSTMRYIFNWPAYAREPIREHIPYHQETEDCFPLYPSNV